jgi:tetratricopeptide (TPR) repeat protein
MKLNKFIFISALIAAGCATSKVNLYTHPSGAEVFSKPLGSGELKSIGVTPLSVDARDLEKRYGGSGPLYIEFRKDGYVKSTTVITELSSVDISMDVHLTPVNGLEDQGHINFLIDTMFECQRLAKAKRYDEALKKLKELELQAPQVAAIYELEGGLYYLLGRYQDALDNYRKSYLYNPKSSQSMRMKNLLEQKYGIDRLPSQVELFDGEAREK